MKMAPYGKSVSAVSNLFIFVGPNSWERAQQRKMGNAMVLPEGDEPKAYKWPINGLEIMLIWKDATRESVLEFGEHLIRSGANLVVAPFEEETSGGFFFRGRP